MEQCSAAIVTKRDSEFGTVVEKLRKADRHIQSLERKFTRAKDKFDELQGDPRSNMVLQMQRVKAPALVTHDRTIETYAASVGVADPSGSLLRGTGSCKAAVVGVDGKFFLIGGVGAEVTKSRIDDDTEGAETFGAPEEMRTNEDSQGSRIDALTEDPRLDDVFGDTEAEGVPVTQVALLGVDEEIVP
ncbi:hypothetical protein AALP_AA5G093200 [Arabis alpina]|uniref:Uncharacterized protein n=1 Tax=Arabis alpina TaxID=50452 RepID=A0A087GVY0_ARAAL|nr:hypothetical protein AALP_AA5G093200 [Arabis alpina]